MVAFVGVFIAGAVFGGFFALRVNQRDVRPRFSHSILSSPPAAVGQTQAPSSGNRPKTPLPQLQLPAAMAVQMYNQGLNTKLVARIVQGGESVDQALTWVERELNTIRRGG